MSDDLPDNLKPFNAFEVANTPHFPMDREVHGLPARFKQAKERKTIAKQVNEYLTDMILDYDRRMRSAFDNFAQGYYPDYLPRQNDVCVAFYRGFEDYARSTFSPEKAKEYCARIFHNVYDDLRDDHWSSPQREKKYWRGVLVDQKDTFGLWYRGVPSKIYGKSLSYRDSWAYLYLWDKGGTMRWRQSFATSLAFNTEMAIRLILDEISTQRFDPYESDLNDDEYENFEPAVLIYLTTQEEMKNVDEALVWDGKPAVFKLRMV